MERYQIFQFQGTRNSTYPDTLGLIPVGDMFYSEEEAKENAKQLLPIDADFTIMKVYTNTF